MSAPRAPPSLLALVVLLNAASPSAGLQPVTSASRTMLSLDGMWRLQVAGRSLTVPVPASYDQFVPGLPEGFAGVATYTRTFRVPAELCDGSHRLSLRFDSANYCATVRLDGVLLTNHSFAGMPFEAEIPAAALVGGGEHTLSVDVDNSRSWQTLPPGMKAEFHGTPVNLVWEGLYNFAGLDGRVHLVATPRRAYVADIETVTTSVERSGASGRGGGGNSSRGSARLSYRVVLGGEATQSVRVSVSLARPLTPPQIPARRPCALHLHTASLGPCLDLSLLAGGGDGSDVWPSRPRPRRPSSVMRQPLGLAPRRAGRRVLVHERATMRSEGAQ